MNSKQRNIIIGLAITLFIIVGGLLIKNHMDNRIITTEYYIVDAKGAQAQVATTKNKASEPDVVDLKLDTDPKTYKDVDKSAAMISIRMSANIVVSGNLDQYTLSHRVLSAGDKEINNNGLYIVNYTNGESYIESK